MKLVRVELYEGRTTAYMVLACIVVAIGGSFFGCDLGVLELTMIMSLQSLVMQRVHRRGRNCIFEVELLASAASGQILA